MDEYIRLDTTIIGIDNLISKASTIEEANALFKAKDVIYSQQRYLTDVQPVKHGRWIDNGSNMWLCSYCKENLIYSETESDREKKQRYCSRCGRE